MDIKDIFKSQKTQLAGVFIGGVVVGITTSYIYDKWRAKKSIVVPAEPKPEQLSFFNGQIDDWANVPLVTMTTDVYPEVEIELMTDELMDPILTIVTKENSWDYEAELSTRDSEEPYVIHYEEFIADEMGYHQETMTYYAGDDIMADPQDTPIYNYAGLMGELKFGHGSNDENVVYIRNEKIHMEWEILLHPGSFELEVLGNHMEEITENELRHSVLKFRRD